MFKQKYKGILLIFKHRMLEIIKFFFYIYVNKLLFWVKFKRKDCKEFIEGCEELYIKGWEELYIKGWEELYIKVCKELYVEGCEELYIEVCKEL